MSTLTITDAVRPIAPVVSTRLRITALPTFLDTTNPTRGAPVPCGSRERCTTTWDRALRTPPRVTARNSSPVRSR